MKSPRFFSTPEKFRAWLEKHHARETELLVGLYRVGSGKPCMTWPESVDEALCFGWIDGVRKTIDDTSYSIRFTPRKTTSIWSNVNIRKVGVLLEQGRMAPAGIAAWEKRDPQRSGIYSFEREAAVFDKNALRAFKANRAAWAFFTAQAPYYQRLATFYVVGAKRPETRARRLLTLIERSANGERLAQFLQTKKKK
ncbi:MAG: hypothetical protein JWM95_3731 [Gemmatimonadetes bacterium]|nr:hypothetical protein [Gemmatimonadota bacterium]